MKTIKILLLTIAIGVLSFSCENDGGDSVLMLEAGSTPDMNKQAGSDGIIDLVRMTSGEVLTLSFNAAVSSGSATPSSIDIIASFVTLEGSVYNATLFSNTSLPNDYEITTEDIVAAFTELNSTADIKLGDVLRISTRFTMPDGRVLSILNDDGTDNTGTTLSNSKLITVVLNYPVSCPSDLAGTYLVSSTGVGCCGVAPITDYEYTVTVTADGGGSYTISDFSGGVYDGLFCGPFGICGDASSGSMTDVCGTLGGSAGDCCGDNIAFSGTVNGDIWTVEVSSGFMFAQSTWVKQ